MEDIKPQIKQTKVIDIEKEVLSQITSFFIGAIVITLFFLLVAGGWLLASKNSLKNLNSKVSDIDSQLAALKDLDKETIAFAGAVSNIQSALNQKKKWPYVFKELNNITPKDVVLSNFSVDESGKVKIDGTVPCLSCLARTLVAFKQSVVFKNVALSGFSLAPDKISFSLSMEAKEQK